MYFERPYWLDGGTVGIEVNAVGAFVGDGVLFEGYVVGDVVGDWEDSVGLFDGAVVGAYVSPSQIMIHYIIQPAKKIA